MAYRDFKYPQVVAHLGLTISVDTVLFPQPNPVVLTTKFTSRLQEGAELAQGINIEKGRSEFIMALFLLELRRMTPKRFGLFSGTEFNVDPDRGLNGFIDFMITPISRTYHMTLAALVVVEANNDNVWNGYGQCVATLVVAPEYNRRAGIDEPIWGISTTGQDWKFLRLVDGDLTIDLKSYYISEPELIAGIVLEIVTSRQAQLATVK